MRRFLKWPVALGLVCVTVLVGCGQPVEQSVIPFKATASIHEFMVWGLEPAADVIWDNAGYVITSDGEQDLQPTTQEGWDHVRNAATVVAESGNLLMMPGYAADQADWAEYAQGMVAAGIQAREAAQAQDADALFQAGANLYSVCLACHNRYIIQDPSSM
jgi:hypothetical protein